MKLFYRLIERKTILSNYFFIFMWCIITELNWGGEEVIAKKKVEIWELKIFLVCVCVHGF